ncbi:MAG: SDR family NAD(P)-dependent oxidoreductase [Gammaproteobacteria bacterium]|nr:SDR family NAD(P)-dependent oxidoreductase [Gammaproteobacteria bacterium]NND55433.1 SDR family NAD(P)-dependent oxidoreductase [Gammaproteobacteria bacterium]
MSVTSEDVSSKDFTSEFLEDGPDHRPDDRQGLQSPRVALVTGASSGIGLAMVQRLLKNPELTTVYAGCRHPESDAVLVELADSDPRVELVRIDVTKTGSLEQAAALMRATGYLDLLVNTAGILHSPAGLQPEKRLKDVNTDDLLLAYDVNALGAMRLAIAMEPLLRKGRRPRFVSLSARVGSISDNRLGGWYAYRASKAALNMLLRTLAIEWARGKPGIVCAALHPGTVATALSEPFTSGYTGTLFSPEQAAQQLLDVILSLDSDDSGGFYAWDGEQIPW